MNKGRPSESETESKIEPKPGNEPLKIDKTSTNKLANERNMVQNFSFTVINFKTIKKIHIC